MKNRFIGFFMAAMMFFNTTSFAAASSKAVAGENEVVVKELTLEEAVKKAIAYSNDLKTIDEDLEDAIDNYKDKANEYNLALDYDEVLNLSTQLRSISNQISNYKLNASVKSAMIELSVKEFFADVISAEKELELYKDSMVIAEKELAISNIKKELGLISEAEYQSAYNSYKSKERELREREVSINNAYISLNTVLGTDMSERYELVLDITYEEFDGDSVEYTQAKALASSQSVITSKQNYDLTVYKKDNDYNSDYADRLTAVSQAARSLSDTMLEVKNSVESMYNQILSIEESYTQNQEKLAEYEKQLEIVKVKYECGNATELDVLNAEYNLNNLKITIEKQIVEHEVLVEKYNNPSLF